MEATEEENRRIASSCKTKCTANAVSKAVGEITKASSEVSEYCANSFPCAGELDKVRAEASNIKKQASDLSDSTGASASSAGDATAAATTAAADTTKDKDKDKAAANK